MTAETLSERIKRLRERAGLSIPKVAERCTKLGSKVSRQSVKKWESGETHSLKFSNLEAFAKAVGATVEEVISGTPCIAPGGSYPDSTNRSPTVINATEWRARDEIDEAAALLRIMDARDRAVCLQLIHSLSGRGAADLPQSLPKY